MSAATARRVSRRAAERGLEPALASATRSEVAWGEAPVRSTESGQG
jgi:hypothetical protein